MKGTRRLPDIGLTTPAWAQDFLVAIKRMLTAPKFPEGDKVLLYNSSTGLTDWVSISSQFTLSDSANSELNVPNVNPPAPPFDDMEEDYPVGAVAWTTGLNPSTLYGVGIWSAITGVNLGSSVSSGSVTLGDLSALQWNNAGVLDGVGLTDGQAIKLTVDNPTLSGNTTDRYGFLVDATFDSSTVDPTFANQAGMAVQLTALNGQNLYGFGTNAKQSFFGSSNTVFGYAAGQHFNEANSIFAFGMGDVFNQSMAINVAGGISANGDEGYGFWTTGFQHYQYALTTTISSVVTPATINTTLTQSVTASQTAQAVTVASTTGVTAGQWITVDYNDASNIEAVKVISVGVGSITGIFRSNHGNGDPITPATVLNIDSGFGFGQGRAVINLSASAYTTGTATPTAGSQNVTGGSTSWSDSMVGGDSHIPGYISFTEDDVDLAPYGSAATLKGWYRIPTVSSGTAITLSRLDVLGEAGFPANTHVVGASAYTIRPGAQILMFDGGINTIVLETNAFTWTAGQTIECAHSVNNNWGGLYLRFTPLMPGRYDAGILIRNSGEFRMGTGLSVDAIGNGSWDVGGTFSSAQTALLLGGNRKAIDILTSGGSGDIHWSGSGYGISMGRNTFYAPGGVDGFVLSTLANDAGGGYDAHESGVEANNGVLSLAYGTPSTMRWNGSSALNGSVNIRAADAFNIYSYNASTVNKINLNAYGDNSGNQIWFKYARGSEASPSAVSNGYQLGTFLAAGYDGSTYGLSGAVLFEATEDFGGSAHGTRVTFYATPNGSATVGEKLIVMGSGLVALGSVTASFPALKPSGAELQARLADDSTYATFDAGAYKVGGTAGITFSGVISAGSALTITSGIITAIT